MCKLDGDEEGEEDFWQKYQTGDWHIGQFSVQIF